MNSYRIRTRCLNQACNAVFEVSFENTGLVCAATVEAANELIQCLKSKGHLTYVFDKTLGRNGRASLPETIVCPKCGAVLTRTKLDYTVITAQNDPEE